MVYIHNVVTLIVMGFLVPCCHRGGRGLNGTDNGIKKLLKTVIEGIRRSIMEKKTTGLSKSLMGLK